MSGDHDIVAAIDELVDESLKRGPVDDYRVNRYHRCPHCDDDWHGLPVTARMVQMRCSGVLDETYRYEDDDSKVICHGSTFIGPMPPPGQTITDMINGLVGAYNELVASVRLWYVDTNGSARTLNATLGWDCPNPGATAPCLIEPPEHAVILPPGPADVIPPGFVDLGYVDEEGIQFAADRDGTVTAIFDDDRPMMLADHFAPCPCRVCVDDRIADRIFGVGINTEDVLDHNPARYSFNQDAAQLTIRAVPEGEEHMAQYIDGCTCHRDEHPEHGHELCCGHEDGRDPNCPYHGDGSSVS